MGKFESSKNNTSLKIKPNQSSDRTKNVKQIFDVTYNYKRDNESHMMKNTEWGAVSYLSLSKYGINKKIASNNNNNFLTGYGSTSDYSSFLPYNTETGYQASTTGNITGVYDMAGCSYEYMASYVQGYLAASGFEEDPSTIYGSKYFDIYSSDSNITSFNKI